MRSFYRAVFRCSVYALLAVAIYVFSFGPVLSLTKSGFIPMHLFITLYQPIPMSVQQELMFYWSRVDARCNRIP